MAGAPPDPHRFSPFNEQQTVFEVNRHNKVPAGQAGSRPQLPGNKQGHTALMRVGEIRSHLRNRVCSGVLVRLVLAVNQARLRNHSSFVFQPDFLSELQRV